MGVSIFTPQAFVDAERHVPGKIKDQRSRSKFKAGWRWRADRHDARWPQPLPEGLAGDHFRLNESSGTAKVFHRRGICSSSWSKFVADLDFDAKRQRAGHAETPRSLPFAQSVV
jgi:hypothetical protein